MSSLLRWPASGRSRGTRLTVKIAALGLPVLLLAVLGTVATTLPYLRTPNQVLAAGRELHEVLAVERYAAATARQASHVLQYVDAPSAVRQELRGQMTAQQPQLVLPDVDEDDSDGHERELHARAAVLSGVLAQSQRAVLAAVDAGQPARARRHVQETLLPTLDALFPLLDERAVDDEGQLLRSLTLAEGGSQGVASSLFGDLCFQLTAAVGSTEQAVLLARMHTTVFMHLATETGFVVTGDPVRRQTATEQLGRLTALADRFRSVAEHGGEDEEQHTAVTVLIPGVKQLRGLPDSLGEHLARGDVAGAARLFDESAHDHVENVLLPVLDALTSDEVAQLEQQLGAASSLAQAMRLWLVLGSIVLLAASTGAAVKLLRQLVVPLRELERAHLRVAAGDLDVAVRSSGQREVRLLAEAFNAMTGRLRQARSAVLAASVVEQSSELVLLVDEAATVRWASPVSSRFLGRSPQELVGQPWLALVHPDDAHAAVGLLTDGLTPGTTAALRLLRGDADAVFTEIAVTDLRRDPDVAAYALVVRDVSERKQQEDQLRWRADHDVLTGLANRHGLQQALTGALERGDTSVIYCDLDAFKDVNDSLGHDVGDALLVALARRLEHIAGEHRPLDGGRACVARLGGDEFAVVVPGTSTAAAAALGERIARQIAAPLTVAGHLFTPGTSVGVATVEQGGDPHRLLRQADLAMYAAKRAGRGLVRTFEPHLEADLLQRLRLERELHEDRQQCLDVHYQPLFAAGDRRIVGVEALLRWTSTDGTRVRPDVLVEAAESSGAIALLGSDVLSRSVRQVAAWRRAHRLDLHLSVNVSALELEQPGWSSAVIATAAAAGLPAAALTIEVTESALATDAVTTTANLETLHAAGVTLSVDDFGTGWSSLARLRQLGADELKLDRSLVTHLDTDGDGDGDEALVRAGLALARELDCRVVAEGVETARQARRLNALGCDILQGFHLGRPVPAAELEQLLGTPAPLALVPAPR